MAREWIAKKKQGWTPYYLRQVERFHEADVFPYVGNLPIRNVTAAHLLEIVRRIEGRGAETVALLVRQWASAIFRYAVATLLSDEAVENGFAGPTLGLECAGVVIAVGAGVEGFGLGDRVVAFGPSSFSNHVTTKAMAVSRIPPGISFEAAATIPSTFFTA